MIFLDTERLRFRTHERRDEPAFVAMQMDAAVRQYVGGAPWPHAKAVQRFRTPYLGKPDDTYGLRATVSREEDCSIGYCGLSGGRGDAHLAYYIAQPYWGRGFATEAARAFIDVAFRRLDVPKVAADVTKGHAASARILAKLGFVYVSEDEVGAAGRVICRYERLSGSARLTAPCFRAARGRAAATARKHARARPTRRRSGSAR